MRPCPCPHTLQPHTTRPTQESRPNQPTLLPLRSSSLPEVVGEAAVLVHPENVFDIARGVQQVLLDPELREDLRRRGRQQLARYSWERSVGRILEIYREAAA